MATGKTQAKSKSPRGPGKPRPQAIEPPVPLPPGCPTALSRAQVAAALDVSTRQLDALVSGGEFPEHDLVVGKSPRWTPELLRSWIEQRQRERRSAAGGR